MRSSVNDPVGIRSPLGTFKMAPRLAREAVGAALVGAALVFVGHFGLSRELVPSREYGFLEAMGATKSALGPGGFTFVWSLPFVLLSKVGAVLGAGAASLAASAFFSIFLFLATARWLAGTRPRTLWDDLAAGAAVVTLLFSLPFQTEACAPGGGVISLLPVFSPLVLAMFFGEEDDPTLDVFLGLSIAVSSVEAPLIGIPISLAALAMRPPKLFTRASVLRFGSGALAGAALAAIPIVATAGRPFFPPPSVPVDSPHEFARTIFRALGIVPTLLVALGAVVGLANARTRRSGVVLTMLIFVLVALATKNPTVAPLARLSVIAILVPRFALALTTLFGKLASSRLPYARLSAGFLFLLATAAPLAFAEDAVAALSEEKRAAEIGWAGDAFPNLPNDSLVFLADERAHLHLLATRVAGGLPKGVELIRVDRRMSTHLDLPDETLREVMRDLVFEGHLRELALTKLAQVRPIFLLFDERYERAIARHLEPVGILDRFAPEPRAPSDRKLALERDRSHETALRASLASAKVAHAYGPMLASFLERRLRALRLVGDKDNLTQVAEELLLVDPTNTLATTTLEKLASDRMRAPTARNEGVRATPSLRAAPVTSGTSR